jgi:GNAT superfamily N-acetyltransferase
MRTHTFLGSRRARWKTILNFFKRSSFRVVISGWLNKKGKCGFLAIQGSYIDRLYVLPDVQRVGIGAALIKRAMELSPTGLELHTHQRNMAARSFYEKHGFVSVHFGVSPAPESEPDVEYHWRPGHNTRPDMALRPGRGSVETEP